MRCIRFWRLPGGSPAMRIPTSRVTPALLVILLWVGAVCSATPTLVWVQVNGAPVTSLSPITEYGDSLCVARESGRYCAIRTDIFAIRKAEEGEKEFLWRAGKGFFTTGNHHAAAVCIQSARGNGIPEDSALFHLSESLFELGHFETALNVNYRQDTLHTSLKEEILFQRLRYFHSLGMDTQAAKLAQRLDPSTPASTPGAFAAIPSGKRRSKNPWTSTAQYRLAHDKIQYSTPPSDNPLSESDFLNLIREYSGEFSAAHRDELLTLDGWKHIGALRTGFSPPILGGRVQTGLMGRVAWDAPRGDWQSLDLEANVDYRLPAPQGGSHTFGAAYTRGMWESGQARNRFRLNHFLMGVLPRGFWYAASEFSRQTSPLHSWNGHTLGTFLSAHRELGAGSKWEVTGDAFLMYRGFPAWSLDYPAVDVLYCEGIENGMAIGSAAPTCYTDSTYSNRSEPDGFSGDFGYNYTPLPDFPLGSRISHDLWHPGLGLRVKWKPHSRVHFWVQSRWEFEYYLGRYTWNNARYADRDKNSGAILLRYDREDEEYYYLIGRQQTDSGKFILLQRHETGRRDHQWTHAMGFDFSAGKGLRLFLEISTMLHYSNMPANPNLLTEYGGFHFQTGWRWQFH